MKQNRHESRQKVSWKAFGWESLGLACFGFGQTAVATSTDVTCCSFSVWAVVSWFLTDVCSRSCSDVTKLIFPSAENQQGFTIVSRCVALHSDGKHTEEQLRMRDNSLEACWTWRVQVLLSSRTKLRTKLQSPAGHVYIMQYTFASLHHTLIRLLSLSQICNTLKPVQMLRENCTLQPDRLV